MVEFRAAKILASKAEDVTSCRVSNEALWDAYCTLDNAWNALFKREGIVAVRQLVQEASGGIKFWQQTVVDDPGLQPTSVDTVLVNIELQRVRLEKAVTLDDESRDTIRDELSDALKELQVVIAAEQVECLLASAEPPLKNGSPRNPRPY